MLTFATLFSGVLGWDEGFRRAGFTPLWACEIGKFQRRVIAKRAPGLTVYPDITTLLGSEVERPDILIASPPCQDLSIAGKRAGFAGVRSGLFFDFARLAGELRPSWILMEQVPGLLSSNERRDFDVALSTLDELGFGVAWRTLDARYFGVPQRRRRVYLVGRFGAPCPPEVLFESEGGEGDLATGEPQGEDLAGTLGGGAPGARGWRGDLDSSGAYIPEVERALTGTMGKHHDPDTDTLVGTIGGGDYGGGRHPSNLYPNLVHTLTGVGFDAGEDGTGRGTPLVAFRKSARMNADPNSPETWVDDGVANTLNSFDVGDVRTTHAIVAATLSNGVNGKAGRRREDDENLVAHTLRANPRNNSDPNAEARMHIQDGASVRRLTPTECERLMGFPDGWTCLCGCDPYSTTACKCPDGPRYAACGNAVVVNKAEWIARSLLAFVEREAEAAA